MNPELLRASIQKEARFEYSRSGGPGGQNVNKVNTKATLRVCLAALDGLSAAELAHATVLLGNRLVDGDLLVHSDEERTQEANRRAALSRAEDLIAGAARIPKKRIATKPSRASKERRLTEKKVRGETKKNRKPGNQE